MSIHDGHRQRLKARFLAEGLDGFTQVQALELLLFYCIPRKDTNPIAHDLISRFGSFSQVLDAPVAELCKVPGVSENAALFLHLRDVPTAFAKAVDILPPVARAECLRGIADADAAADRSD